MGTRDGLDTGPLFGAPAKNGLPEPAARTESGGDNRGGPAADFSRRGRLIRLALTAAAGVLLLFGTVAGNDDMFPFGPFKMYAGRYPANGLITSDTLLAQTAGGRNVVVNGADTGLTRAEMEGEITAFKRNPGRLADLAQAYHRRHPEAPPYVEMRIVQERWQLHNRAVVSQSSITLAEWHAP
ncbi:MAG TPA: hypothetical protein VH637_14025 [Streptosporangiaceae bacterium]